MSKPVSKPGHQQNGLVVPAGTLQTVNERIDPSVSPRCQRYSDAGSKGHHRPASLTEWVQRENLDMEKVISGTRAEGLG
jgi:hypothetical protein